MVTGELVLANTRGMALTVMMTAPFAQVRKVFAFILLWLVPQADAGLREELLAEARKRLTIWYAAQDQMEWPFWSYQARIQVTKHWYWCDAKGGTAQVPITFAEFNVSNARPVDVFNTLTDTKQQVKWDNTVSDIHELADFPSEGVRGVQMLMPSGIWLVPPREFFEWAAFNASMHDQEFWFVASTLENEHLYELRTSTPGAVEANTCLAAFWIRPCPASGEQNCPPGNPINCCPAGGSHVRFTQHVNVHPPPLISEKTIFDNSWYKTIDWVNLVRKNAAHLAASGASPHLTVVPQSLLSHESSGGVLHVSFTSEIGPPGRLFQVFKAAILSVGLQGGAVSLLIGLAMILLAAAGMALSWRRSFRPSSTCNSDANARIPELLLEANERYLE